MWNNIFKKWTFQVIFADMKGNLQLVNMNIK